MSFRTLEGRTIQTVKNRARRLGFVVTKIKYKGTRVSSGINFYDVRYHKKKKK